MTESTLSFFMNLALICGICVALLRVAEYRPSDGASLPDMFLALFFFDKH